MADVGYLRVSTPGQNTARQLEGATLKKKFVDYASGTGADRPQLAACLDYLREGDTLHVHSMDRLGRNVVELDRLIQQLTADGVKVQFHAENLTFGPSAADPTAKLLFQVMGAVAEFERRMIRARQREGIARAKKRGVYKGSRPRIDRRPILAALEGGMRKSEVVRRFKVSRSTLYRILADAGKSPTPHRTEHAKNP